MNFGQGGRLFFGDLDHFPALIAPAVRACPVGQFRLMTIRALRDTGGAKRVVAPAVGSAPLGMSSFRIWHLDSFYTQFFQGRPAVVHRFHLTAALHDVAVLPAKRADPLASITADALHR